MFGDKFPKGLRMVSHCPVCSGRYQPFEATVLDAREDAHLMYVQCRKCNSSILALIYLDRDGANSVGLVTDLTKEEVMQYRGAEEVNADDVIAAHQLLHA